MLDLILQYVLNLFNLSDLNIYLIFFLILCIFRKLQFCFLFHYLFIFINYFFKICNVISYILVYFYVLIALLIYLLGFHFLSLSFLSIFIGGVAVLYLLQFL